MSNAVTRPAGISTPEVPAAEAPGAPTGEPTFVEVGTLDGLEPEEPRRVDVSGVPVLLVRTGPEVFAIAPTCTHETAALDGGFVDDGCIECPRHGARFDLRSGAALTLPATRDLRTYPVRLEGRRILVAPTEKKRK